MNKKRLWILMACIVMLFLKNDVNIVRGEEVENNIAYEDAFFEMTPIVQSERANNYSSYSFHKVGYISIDESDGSSTRLVKMEANGIVYFYVDGKVHLYSLSASSQSLVTGITSVVDSVEIVNTDGTISKGNIHILNGSYSALVRGNFLWQVVFNFGSSQANWSLYRN